MEDLREALEQQQMYQHSAHLQAAFQCAPVLFGIKPSNLLILKKGQIQKVRNLMVKVGVHFYRLCQDEKREIWFVYWPETMRYLLGRKDVRLFLEEQGYESLDLIPLLKRTGERYRAYQENSSGFPHELGILLGYPVADVRGFILHNGQKYLCTGYWKVYENEENAKRIFSLYEEAKRRIIAFLAAEGMLSDCQAA